MVGSCSAKNYSVGLKPPRRNSRSGRCKTCRNWPANWKLTCETARGGMNPSLPQAPTQESDLAEATQVARWVFWLCHAQAPGRFLRREFRQLLTELQRIGLAHRLHRQARPPESTGVLACHPFILRLGHHKHTQLKARFGFRFNSKVCPPPYRGIPAKRLFNWVAVDIKIKKSMPATTRKSSHAPTVPGQQADSVPVGA